jgi:hypothetical protein
MVLGTARHRMPLRGYLRAMTPRTRHHVTRAVLAVVLVALLAACAAGANPQVDVAGPDGDTAGFFLGVWHGAIAPITFFISLFSNNVSIYDVHNNGNWYDFGFVLGAGILFSGGFLGGRKR